mmetsp:Transcript_7692/g.17983  ORF Transcript_7692/g.17983 Transcript_7692/m.17983 type:complete len:207 (-) Transcript_7692:1222-1842(-)
MPRDKCSATARPCIGKAALSKFSALSIVRLRIFLTSFSDEPCNGCNIRVHSPIRPFSVLLEMPAVPACFDACPNEGGAAPSIASADDSGLLGNLLLHSMDSAGDDRATGRMRDRSTSSFDASASATSTERSAASADERHSPPKSHAALGAAAASWSANGAPGSPEASWTSPDSSSVALTSSSSAFVVTAEAPPLARASSMESRATS